MNAFRFGFFSAALGVLLSTNAQTWNLPGNQITLPTQYLGCNALSTSPLQLITVPRLSIDFYTENRMLDRRSSISHPVTLSLPTALSLSLSLLDIGRASRRDTV